MTRALESKNFSMQSNTKQKVKNKIWKRPQIKSSVLFLVVPFRYNTNIVIQYTNLNYGPSTDIHIPAVSRFLTQASPVTFWDQPWERLRKKQAWVPEVGLTAKRNAEFDEQETLHRGFQNETDLHTGKRLRGIHTIALRGSKIQILTVRRFC